MLPNRYRSKVDRSGHCYLYVNCQYRENVVILNYIYLNNSYIYYNIKSILI